MISPSQVEQMADVLDRVQPDMLGMDLKEMRAVEFLLGNITGRFNR